MERERACKSAAQKSDSILNHILKNVMVDASGCIDLFLLEKDVQSLAKAVDILFRGTWWCRLREALLRITTGTYTPDISAVDLQEFGANLAKGRLHVSVTAPPELVRLDPLACNIVLDNAISNAIRHGCPRDPQVGPRCAFRSAPSPLGSRSPWVTWWGAGAQTVGAGWGSTRGGRDPGAESKRTGWAGLCLRGTMCPHPVRLRARPAPAASVCPHPFCNRPIIPPSHPHFLDR